MTRENLLAVAEAYGSPLYVYDTTKMESQYKRLTKAFSKVKQVKVNYAVKALSNISVLKFLHSLGAGMDTVSIQVGGPWIGAEKVGNSFRLIIAR